MKLLNPGPVTLTTRVKQALLREDLCHREQSFAELTLRVVGNIRQVYPASASTHVPVLLTGSGTSAVEAMLALVPLTRDAGGKRTLVLANGVYGDRAAQMLKVQGKEFEVVAAPWTSGIDLAGARAALATGKFAHVVAVHHETTTGRLNDIAAVGALCKEFGAGLLLDAVSSFGGEHIDFDAWNIEGCAGTANKCLHAVPGIAFVVAKTDVFAARPSGATSLYLDLFRYKKEQEAGWSPFTQSVQGMFALDEALSEFAQAGGLVARHQAYSALRDHVIDGLARLGIELFLPERSSYSSMLVSYKLPASLTYPQLHDHLFAQGFTIYAGQGPFSGQMFRIANMGDLTVNDMDRLLNEIASLLRPAR
jgi:2-aminoethylphosphonate-pyruvate transaminase